MFGCDPVDWARYPDGKLTYISPTGQKFGYTKEQFDNIADAVRIERAAKKKLSGRKSKSKTESILEKANSAFLPDLPDVPPGAAE